MALSSEEDHELLFPSAPIVSVGHGPEHVQEFAHHRVLNAKAGAGPFYTAHPIAKRARIESAEKTCSSFSGAFTNRAAETARLSIRNRVTQLVFLDLTTEPLAPISIWASRHSTLSQALGCGQDAGQLNAAG